MRATTMAIVASLTVACGPGETPLPEDLDSLTGRPTLTIGMTDGPGEFLFGRVAGVTLGPLGHIFVADAQADQISVFSGTGEFEYRIGRSGEGPGELKSPCCLAFDQAGLLWVRDTGNSRYQSFRINDSSGVAHSTLRIEHAASNLWAPTTFDGQGRLIDVGSNRDGFFRRTRSSDGATVGETPIPSPSVEELGGFSVERTMGESQVVMFLHPPFGARHLVAHGPGGSWADAISSEHRVRLHTPSGDSVEISVVPHAEVPLSDREIEIAQERMLADAGRSGRSVTQLPYGVPGNKLPLVALHFDTVGRLWVERATQDGTSHVADIYSATGTLISRAEWPAAVSLRSGGWIGSDMAVGVRLDEFDVPRVVVLRFSP